MCPLNNGSCSGSLPFSLIGITANAPPPLACQLTEIYCGFACGDVSTCASPPRRHIYSHLYKVCVPGVVRYPQIIVTLLLCGIRSVVTCRLPCEIVRRTFLVGRPKICPVDSSSAYWKGAQSRPWRTYDTSTRARIGRTFALMHRQLQLNPCVRRSEFSNDTCKVRSQVHLARIRKQT